MSRPKRRPSGSIRPALGAPAVPRFAAGAQVVNRAEFGSIPAGELVTIAQVMVLSSSAVRYQIEDARGRLVWTDEKSLERWEGQTSFWPTDEEAADRRGQPSTEVTS